MKFLIIKIVTKYRAIQTIEQSTNRRLYFLKVHVRKLGLGCVYILLREP